MEDQDPKQPQFRGLYRYVNISVKTLDKIILVGIAAIVLVLLFGMSHRGYTVTFDSKGGTDVAQQTRMYGELVEVPEPPQRQGYTFDGWYQDENCTIPWDLEVQVVTDSMTLYAGWQPEQ